jgi:NAD(P)-dependent dehydrogenase (short-subunit alcohol dehydrogenase family)
MRIDLSGKTALVTGSTAGIGFAIAEGLLAADAAVIVNGRTQQRVDAALRALHDSNRAGLGGAIDRLDGIAADVGNADGCAAIADAFPDVDILVNNTGVYDTTPIFNISDEEWLRIYETNVLSGVRLSRAYMPGMIERLWGRVIFISSESALQIPAEMVHYGVTKTAQLAVARGLAESFAGSGVTVNSVLPGPTTSEGLTEWLQQRVDSGAADSLEQAGREFIAESRPTSLLGRPTTPEEVSNMVVYVASEQASATTGAALRVDGGVVRAIP